MENGIKIQMKYDGWKVWMYVFISIANRIMVTEFLN